MRALAAILLLLLALDVEHLAHAPLRVKLAHGFVMAVLAIYAGGAGQRQGATS